MRVIFEMVTKGQGSHRARFNGADVQVDERVDFDSELDSIGGCFIVRCGDESFGAYGDELVLVPEPVEGKEYPCPSCGEAAWRVWYTTDEAQDAEVTFGERGPEVVDYLGNSESGEGVGEDESIYCSLCGYTEELRAAGQVKTDAEVLDELAKYLRLPVWGSGADFLEWVACLVKETGRDIVNGLDIEGEAQGTAKEG